MGNLLKIFSDDVWAITESKFEAITSFLELRSQGITSEWVNANIEAKAAAERLPPAEGSIAVINIFGTIARRVNMMTEFSGGTSIQGLSNRLDEALNNDTVSTILLNIDSPGGAVGGTPELADKIYKARKQKSIYAIADTMAASAAYWLGSSAEKLIVTPSGEVGSIGVLAVRWDKTEAMANAGVKAHIIKAGKYKDERHPEIPMTDDERSEIQSRVDEYYAMFVNAVARNRNVTASVVRKTWGEGRTFGAEKALELGMVDRIATYEDVLKELTANVKSRKERQASAQQREQMLVAFKRGLINESNRRTS